VIQLNNLVLQTLAIASLEEKPNQISMSCTHWNDVLQQETQADPDSGFCLSEIRLVLLRE
jgi:hypothetical protein